MAVAAPTVVVEPEAGRAVITVNLPNFADVGSFTVRRTNTQTGVTRDVRTLIDIEPLGTLTQGFDYELASGVPVTYAVTVVYRAGGSETSPASPPVTWTTDAMWLKHIAQPERNMTVTVEGIGSLSYDQPQGVYDVLARRNPIVISDLQSGAAGSLALLTFTLAERDALLSITAPGSVLLFQAPAEYGLASLYLAPGPLTEERPARRGWVPVRRWSLDFTEVDPPELAITVSDFTYQTVLDSYATYQQVLDNEVSYYDLLTSPGEDEGRAASATSSAPSAPEALWAWPELTPTMAGEEL